MGPLVELPGWLQAAGWGLLSASGLLIGAVGGDYTWLQHTTIARVMTFAAGVLLAVVAVDLVINARGAASLHWTVMGLLCGAAVFSSVNWLLSRRGAQHRKRCGECVEHPEEEQQPGSGLAASKCEPRYTLFRRLSPKRNLAVDGTDSGNKRLDVHRARRP